MGLRGPRTYGGSGGEPPSPLRGPRRLPCPRLARPSTARSMMAGQFFSLVLTGAFQFGHGVGGSTTNFIHSGFYCVILQQLLLLLANTARFAIAFTWGIRGGSRRWLVGSCFKYKLMSDLGCLALRDTRVATRSAGQRVASHGRATRIYTAQLCGHRRI